MAMKSAWSKTTAHNVHGPMLLIAHRLQPPHLPKRTSHRWSLPLAQEHFTSGLSGAIMIRVVLWLAGRRAIELPSLAQADN